MARGEWSQTDLGEAVGVPQTTVSRWESGQTEPTITQVLMIEQKRGLPTGTILREAGLVAEGDAVTVEEAIQADRELDDALKISLKAVYWMYAGRDLSGRQPGRAPSRKRG